MKENTEPSPDLLNRLKFRRQFLVGPDTYTPNQYWITVQLKHNLHLSVHEDLPFQIEKNQTCQITVIGSVIDCTAPDKTPAEITASLIEQCKSIESVILASKPLAGRWIIIFQDTDDTCLFTDPCGQRKVYYYAEGDKRWCASQPTLINQVKEMQQTSNRAILEFRKSAVYKNKQSKWFSNKTEYEGCYHLYPNHYLDLHTSKQVRFFPLSSTSLPVCENYDPLISEAATYLKNIMTGINRQYDLKIALTSGFDSRLLLAASKDISSDTTYYVDNLGYLKKHHDEIYVPQNLKSKFNLQFSIMDAEKDVLEWFKTLLTQSVSEARVDPMIPTINSIYSRLIRDDTDYVIINGNMTEILRIKKRKIDFAPFIEENRGSSNAQVLMNFSGYNNKTLLDEIGNWAETIDVSSIDGATILDMFYWEVHMGNWGALDPAEKDIATEQISPFNCRLLMETCLQVPRNRRMAPDYEFFTKMIEELWPEVLSEPINPGPKGFGWLKLKGREYLPDSIVKALLSLKRLI